MSGENVEKNIRFRMHINVVFSCYDFHGCKSALLRSQTRTGPHIINKMMGNLTQ